MKPIEIDMEQPLRICRDCDPPPIKIAIAFEKHLPKGFGWDAAVIRYTGGRKQEVERRIHW